MPINKSNSDAEDAAAYARAAEKSLRDLKVERAAAEASLAVYYQLRAAEDQNGTLANALMRHAVAMEEWGPR